MSARFDTAARLTAWLLLCGAMPVCASDGVPDTGWIDREALTAGEIEARTSKDGPSVQVDIAALIDAEPKEIWKVLTSCEVAPEYVSNILSCKLIERIDDGRAELFVQTVKPVFFVPRFEHVFRLDYHPYERIDVTDISGPLERMEGAWYLLPEADGKVLLIHSMEVDPGFPIPRFMLRAGLKRDMTTIMEAVRNIAEGKVPPPDRPQAPADPP